MVESIKMAVMASPTTPMVVSCPVAFRNSEKYWLTSCSMVGTKFLSRKSSICPLTLLKNGKGRKNSQADGKQWNDGNQRGVAERGGNPENSVVFGSFGKEKQKFPAGGKHLSEFVFKAVF